VVFGGRKRFFLYLEVGLGRVWVVLGSFFEFLGFFYFFLKGGVCGGGEDESFFFVFWGFEVFLLVVFFLFFCLAERLFFLGVLFFLLFFLFLGDFRGLGRDGFFFFFFLGRWATPLTQLPPLSSLRPSGVPR